ncbi:MAG: hypothetical protein RML72_04845 [Bacteroidia bacterium]|nr:hypothetical protein [Bacteroidia bacterium]MDW8158190.1 hypothetical protein [Bacteroidia bacterium]
MAFETPILFIIFNRPETTRQVFQRIREIQPTKLYVSADGPRPNKVGDQEACAATRAIIDQVDWPCIVKKNFLPENVGCKLGVSGAINWFFSYEEQGIILEDDCLPHLSFFYYCQTLLDYYKNDTRIMHIGGNNWQDGQKWGDAAYYFSIYPHIWGWATWRRAWQYFDIHMGKWPLFLKGNYLSYFFPTFREQKYWKKKFHLCYKGIIRTAWSYQWFFTNLCQHGLSITPNVNLVSNIGFDGEGTNIAYFGNKHPMANVATQEISITHHPNIIAPNRRADLYTFNKIFSPPLKVKIINKFWQTFYRLQKKVNLPLL